MISQIDLFSDDPHIVDFDTQVVTAVRKMSYDEKRSSMIFGLAEHQVDYIRMLIQLSEHAPLMRSNIHKTDMTSKEFHTLEDMLNNVSDFSHTVNTIWEDWAITHKIGIPND